MSTYLILRLDAPLMSFGAPLVDAIGKTERFVGRSMIAGLLANALGYDHSEWDKTQQLQDRLRIASRCDRRGGFLEDYQTVDLGQRFMLDKNAAWTTWGRVDARRGKKATSKGTHIRRRHYLVDSVYTIAIGLAPDGSIEGEMPSIKELAEALREPARPLYIGRKPCIPSAPILFDVLEARSPLDALTKVARISEHRQHSDGALTAWWDRDDGGPEPKQYREIAITDERDWRNQIHCGRRMIRFGLIDPPREGSNV